MNMNLTKLFANFSLILISIVFSLMVGEGLVRVASIGGVYVSETGNQYKFYEFDHRLGWRNSPNRFGKYTRDEFSYKISINSYGMRYKDFSIDLSNSRKRIAVLGDSFTWGIGVSNQERYTEIVENKTSNKFELLNFGVSGYGPIQHYLLVDEILDKFKPEVLLITFCLSNDFADNVLWKRYDYYKPYVRVDELYPIKVSGYPLPRSGELSTGLITDWLSDHSRLFSLFRSTTKFAAPKFIDYGQAGLINADENQFDIYFPNRSPESKSLSDQMVLVNSEILKNIRDIARKRGVIFAVVVAPTKCEYGSCFQGELEINMSARQQLLKTLKYLDIPAIDPTDSITIADFWKTDGHWRSSGHEKVAEEILNWLRKNNLSY